MQKNYYLIVYLVKNKTMWQKCPICNGTGRTHNTLLSRSYNICSTCNGTKIISQLNGLPPNLEQNKIELQKENSPITIKEVEHGYVSQENELNKVIKLAIGS